MGKLQDFLMTQAVEPGTETEVEIKGFPYPFKIKAITEGENKALRKTCQRVTTDKITRQKRVETDSDLYTNRLVAACCVEPNFKDAELQAHYGVMGAEQLIDKLLSPGQFTSLFLAIQSLNGMDDDEDINELMDEAKNS